MVLYVWMATVFSWCRSSSGRSEQRMMQHCWTSLSQLKRSVRHCEQAPATITGHRWNLPRVLHRKLGPHRTAQPNVCTQKHSSSTEGRHLSMSAKDERRSHTGGLSPHSLLTTEYKVLARILDKRLRLFLAESHQHMQFVEFPGFQA